VSISIEIGDALSWVLYFAIIAAFGASILRTVYWSYQGEDTYVAGNIDDYQYRGGVG
jgi:hypothetical protein